MKAPPQRPGIWAATALATALAAGLALAGLRAQAQTSAALAAQGGIPGRLVPPHYGLQARPIADRTWVVEGAVQDFHADNGCNIVNTGFIHTKAGVWVINTGPSLHYGRQQRALVARTTGSQPVQAVLNLNPHPDHFFGNQAWAGHSTLALDASRVGMAAEGEAYAQNLFRLCGEWLQGTQPTPAQQAPATAADGSLPGSEGRLLTLVLSGHTAQDLVVIDRHTGVAFVGGLVFADRAPTTPHAQFDNWLRSLDTLEALHRAGQFHTVVPSHGPVHRGLHGLQQTRDWLLWLTAYLRRSAEAGLELAELLAQPLPPRFAAWAAQDTEWPRTLARWYPPAEAAALAVPSTPAAGGQPGTAPPSHPEARPQ
jgi:quinoprotein relay system zinc metallohydrolase 1